MGVNLLVVLILSVVSRSSQIQGSLNDKNIKWTRRQDLHEDQNTQAKTKTQKKMPDFETCRPEPLNKLLRKGAAE